MQCDCFDSTFFSLSVWCREPHLGGYLPHSKPAGNCHSGPKQHSFPLLKWSSPWVGSWSNESEVRGLACVPGVPWSRALAAGSISSVRSVVFALVTEHSRERRKARVEHAAHCLSGVKIQPWLSVAKDMILMPPLTFEIQGGCMEFDVN